MKEKTNWLKLSKEPRAGREWTVLVFLKESIDHEFKGTQVELSKVLDINHQYLNTIIKKLKKEHLVVVTKGKIRLAAMLLKEPCTECGKDIVYGNSNICYRCYQRNYRRAYRKAGRERKK